MLQGSLISSLTSNMINVQGSLKLQNAVLMSYFYLIIAMAISIEQKNVGSSFLKHFRS